MNSMAEYRWNEFQGWCASVKATSGTFCQQPWESVPTSTQALWAEVVQQDPHLMGREINKRVRQTELIQRVKALELSPDVERCLLDIEQEVRADYEESVDMLLDRIEKLSDQLYSLEERTHG